MDKTTADEKIKGAVREAYGDIARRFVEEPTQASCCGPSQSSSCDCGPSGAAVEIADAAARLYSEEELANLPDSVTDISLGCGNPTTIAELQPGEVVLDLGSGGGIDCFLAAKKVGPEGRVIGLDMTPDMIKLARRNARKMGATNVEFRYGEMEDIPLPDESVDVIISNCVINLSPDKAAVFAEAHRVLRPGGRLSVSDIVVYGELPPAIRDRLDAWAGCLAGALDESDYLGKMRAAGLEDVEVLSRDYVKISTFEDWVGVREVLIEAGLSPGDLDQTVASIKVTARKPA
jgi:arsenite methyltransferase